MLQWMDNFRAYGVGGQARMLNGPYAQMEGTLVADPDPNVSGSTVLRLTPLATNGTSARRVLTGARKIVGVAARYWLDQLPQNGNVRTRLISFRNVTNSTICHVTVDPSGYIHVRSGPATSGNIIASSEKPVMIANAWRHVEFKCTFDDTDGAIEIRVEGVTVVQITGVNTSPSGALCHNVAFQNQGDTMSFGPQLSIKDVIIWDGTGDHNNDFLGSCSVVSLIPDADVTLGGWVPSTGMTGFNLINGAPPNDTTFVAADDSPPAACEFGLSNLPVDVTSVKGLMTLPRLRKTDGGDANVQVSLISNGEAANGENRPITTAFTYWPDISEEDPDTGAPWLPIAVDAASLRINRTL